MTDFEATPIDRYSRHRLIDWWDQDKLATARVLVVGAGAIGNEAIKNLALLGIGHITILDFDRVDFSNLSRSVLFRPTDVGRWKADVAAAAASLLNSDTRITSIVGDLEFSIGIGELREYSVILGYLDSINARWALNRLSFAAGVPWINAGINPTAGEISLFVPYDGACYECTMSDTMWQRFNERYSCNKLLRDLPPRTLPTTITLAALTASLQVQEALIQIHGLTEHVSLRPGQKAYFSVKPYTFFIVDLPKNPDCLAHEATRIDISMHANPQDIALADVFQPRPPWNPR